MDRQKWGLEDYIHVYRITYFVETTFGVHMDARMTNLNATPWHIGMPNNLHIQEAPPVIDGR